MQGGLTGHARRVFGVAGLALREALRSKTVVGLLGLLAVCVAVLPGVVKGDGTSAGELKILLAYTLGLGFGILCLSTLWSACALFAAEIDRSRIHLSVVKPVCPVEFWMGKWLALLLLNALLLAAVYAGVYGQIVWRMRRNGWAETDRPLCLRVAHPVLPTPREEARQTFAILKRLNKLPKGMSEAAVLRTLEEKAGDKYDSINPGDSVRWAFRLSRPLTLGDPLTVRIRFDTEFSSREQVKGVCRLAVAGDPLCAVDVELDDLTQNELEFVVDTRAFASARPAASGLQNFELSFRHAGDTRRSAALMLRFRKDVELLTPGGSFEANLVRALLVQWTVLAMLAAFGLSVSACFSLPVAAFVSTLLLVLALVGNSVVEGVSDSDEQVLGNRVGIWVSRVTARATRQVMQASPLTGLTRGERVEREVLIRSVLWNGLCFPALFAVAGCWVLRRRELADVG